MCTLLYIHLYDHSSAATMAGESTLVRSVSEVAQQWTSRECTCMFSGRMVLRSSGSTSVRSVIAPTSMKRDHVTSYKDTVGERYHLTSVIPYSLSGVSEYMIAGA